VAAEDPSHVTLARVSRPQGRRGEVAAEILTDFPERLKSLTAVELWDGRSKRTRVNIRSCWLTVGRNPQAIFHFEGSDSISDAERLVGLEVQVPIADRVSLPQGSYYISDLIGCEVWEASGEQLGTVVDVQTTGEEISGTPILEIDTPPGELLVPLADEICRSINTVEKRIEVLLPEGLRELNQQ
jgi:16S rRNA processing protein RimM